MRQLKVLISGASIAGPALALWLARYGAAVTLVERWPELRTGGQLVDLRGVSREVIRRMGVEADIRAASEDNFGLSFVDTRGRTRGEIRSDQFGGDGPVAEIEILRGSLSRVLYERSRDRVDYRFGDRITSVRDEGAKVRVEFETGPAESFDVVVGADGLHSELRGTLFGPEAQFVRHLGTYVSFWTARNHLALKDWTVVYSEPDRTIGMRSILGGTKVMAFLTFRGGRPSYDWRDVDAQKRIAQARAYGMGWEGAALLSQIDTAPDFYFDTCSQVNLPAWSAGRVGLVGDAAYCASPLSGHGATIAMVGAYVLAGELARTPDDITGAFARYEAGLRPWVERIQRSAPGQGRVMTPRTSRGIALRNGVTRLAGHLPRKELLLRSTVRMSNSMLLDDYSRYLVGAGRP
ncbi:FAD-dependent monooxygenase [Streptomyces albipurpureus]|uniref:FAD-dependent monooxygenase n=1 Tax=Streptomyces albipurpureus TaxID=2897419 RepID=A0ABT0UR98_9ACTN|nr:FAD-dependent monooxygenase [Streptomyces sp. CWNU-1]MCM2389771.1 FAD-dependent monooxygenase [Streptomyces sp. CWNU-1]